MKKKLALCGLCAAKLATAYNLRKIGDVDGKTTCAECGKRYSATYEVTKKEGHENA